jgi:Protein of unknown function (DUF2721)
MATDHCSKISWRRFQWQQIHDRNDRQAETSMNVEQLSTIISHAVAPAFLLGAVAALVSILVTRMTAITDRIRNLNQITDDDTARIWLKADIARLKRREKLLNHALQLAVACGLCITFLLFVGFVFGFLGYRHEPGAAVLFIVALCLLGGSLIRFLQDVRISLSEPNDHH